MHGGNSPGAPRRNQNAMKHGRYTLAQKLERFEARQTIRELRTLIRLARESDPDTSERKDLKWRAT